jgi:3-hydroxy acid dehydrogenase / malonic semialdehyde reductase
LSRQALVTGASSGIGRAIALLLRKEGWRVVGTARDVDRLEGASADFLPLVLELNDLDALEQRLRSLPSELPEIDALILVAGRGLLGGLEEMSPRAIRSLIDLNLTAQILITRAFWPQLRRNAGHLILLGSEAALAGKRQGSVYCATKFALRGFAQALREEGARAGVRVTIVHPGVVATAFFDHLDIEPGPLPENSLSPADVARAVLMALEAPRSAVVDEIVLSPLKRLIRTKKR